WSRALKNKASRLLPISIKKEQVFQGVYYPFVKKYLYYDSDILEYPRKFKETVNIDDNKYISISGAGTKKNFSALINHGVPNYNLLDKARHFELFLAKEKNSLFFQEEKRYNVSSIEGLSTENSFYYVYGVLNSKQYQEKYQNDLRKDIPRIPTLNDKEKYVEIGRKLADLHLNYEDIPAYDSVNIVFKSDNPSFKVKKMKHPKRGQLDTIIFNEDIVITDIPERAYEYVVNGKPAIEWIIDQYQVKKDKKSGIVDDPNEFSDNPKYIFNLLLSIINVSMQTMDLVESLPPLEIID
ncbi:helicase, partial [Enterococcus hirae]|nr:helicase [Enterococcus hirae]